MGLNVPLFEFSAEQDVNPQIMSISARSSMKSPALDRGGFTATVPASSTVTFIKTLNVVPICEGAMPKGFKAVYKFSKQLG